MKQTIFLLLGLLWLCGCSVVTPPPPTISPTLGGTRVPQATHIPTVTASPFAPNPTETAVATESAPTATHTPTAKHTETATEASTATQTRIPTTVPGRPKTLPESGAPQDVRLRVLWLLMLFGFSLFLIGIGLWQSGNEHE